VISRKKAVSLNKSESKYFNTAVKMDKALMTLLEKKDFEYITIKELCAEAGVNRSTFYLHYETMMDLLKETLSYLNSTFDSYFAMNEKETMEKIETGSLNDLIFITKEHLEPYLKFVKDYKRTFMAVIKCPNIFASEDSFELLSDKVFYPIMKRYHISENMREYILMFYIKGIIGILLHWIERDCEDSVEFITDLIIGLIMTDIKKTDNIS